MRDYSQLSLSKFTAFSLLLSRCDTLIDWSIAYEALTKKIVSLLFGRAQNGYTPHIYFVSASRIYSCHVRRYVAGFGLGRGDCFYLENRLIQLTPGTYVYVRLCIYGVH